MPIHRQRRMLETMSQISEEPTQEPTQEPTHRPRVSIKTDDPDKLLILSEDSSGDSYIAISAATRSLHNSARFCGPGGGSRVPHRIRMAIKQLHDAALHPEDNTPLVLIHNSGLDKEPQLPEHGKFGLSFYDVARMDEGPYDTEDDAMRSLADLTPEQRTTIGEGMYLINCYSWYPRISDDFGNDIVDSIEDQWCDAVEDAESFLDDQLDAAQKKEFTNELRDAARAILYKHIKKPRLTLEVDRLVTWEMADEWIEAHPAAGGDQCLR